ncbi:MAG: DNA cytosine methyltransferase [Bacteroidales bacterium]|nr:DNA cytosine methyltransferase [Bacteroidales bacterium]
MNRKVDLDSLIIKWSKENKGVFNEVQYLNEDGTVLPFSEIMAYISHYLQNQKYGYSSYMSKAQNILDYFFDCKIDTSQTIASDSSSVYMYNMFSPIVAPRFKSIDTPKFTFIDLFAGIGGFRIAMQNLGGKCVFSSEWDKDAQKTYFANFGEVPFGDITKQHIKDCIPQKFDILCAGFPCQAFSIAGHRKGFEDTRGTLFFDVAQILKDRKPRAFFLENVKNLKSHDSGNTYQVIENTLKDLGYIVYSNVLNSMTHANIPQNRERIFIVGFDPKRVPNHTSFKFPEAIELSKTIHDCINLEETDKKLFYSEEHMYYPMLKEAMVNPNTIYQWRRKYVRENQSNVCPTLTANMGEGGHNVPLIITPSGYRKLTPKECLNFQGYPEEYNFPNIAQSKKYKQAGNSVTVPLIQRVAQKIYEVLCK